MRFWLNLIILTVIMLVPLCARADVGLSTQGLYLKTSKVFEGTPVRIYAKIDNSGADAQGRVKFFLDSQAVQIGSDQLFTALSGQSGVVFVDLYPPKGQHEIIAKVFPWNTKDDNPANNLAKRTIFVQADNDHDLIADNLDPDDDNDGTPDESDQFPLDKNEQSDNDKDGYGDNVDDDDDNDGTLDQDDALPKDPNETKDLDGDGIGDNADEDDDGDDILDVDEEKLGLDPLKKDSDGDGVKDGADAFPLNPSESLDTDRDGVGNNTDSDDDGDKVSDALDPLPLNHGPIIYVDSSRIKISNVKTKFSVARAWDPDGKIAKAIWDFGDQKREGLDVVRVFTEPGDYKVELTVFDDRGEGRKLTLEFKVWSAVWFLPLVALLIAVTIAIIGKLVYSLRVSGRG